MNVAFVNENTMGHSSYLLPFVQRFQEHTELDIIPHLIDAAPLPKGLSSWGEFSVPGLRQLGLDFGCLRWRAATSRHVSHQLDQLRARQNIDAVVVNTQSVALALETLASEIPLLICLDATFRQLAASPWFSPTRASDLFLPITIGPLIQRERRIFKKANRLLCWSEEVRDSLFKDYACSPDLVRVLPPSIQSRSRSGPRNNSRPQILFVGGDFERKGGELLLECYREWFASTCDLHLVTYSEIKPEPGVYVHRGVQPFSKLWYERWQNADVFVFPSALETFGIVLLEALAFEVPVISSEVGAARSILLGGRAGLLMQERTPESLAKALRQVLDDPRAARERAIVGRNRIEQDFDLTKNTKILADWLHTAVKPTEAVRAPEPHCEPTSAPQ
jgi:glycosyltransferase involved in cell wall biosynthesis